jgi:glycerol-3-phosphate dehydrogenase
LMLAGTWLYWLLGRCKTQTPKLLSRSQIAKREPLIKADNSRGGVEYSDAYLHDNDARFVFNFIRNAIDKGCIAANYIESVTASRDQTGQWITEVEDQVSGDRFNIRSKTVINATGAFVDQYNQITGIETDYCHVFSKGIHLVVPRISDRHQVLAFFADDGRLFFAIPMGGQTCIGTTDTRVSGPLTEVTDEDRDFVLSNINAQLNLVKPLTWDDVIAERCGVRPLAIRKGHGSDNDFLQLSRKHVVETDFERNYVSIFGGKLTDCLNVGDEICDRVADLGVDLPNRHTSTGQNKWYGEPMSFVKRQYFERAEALGLDKVKSEDTEEMLSVRLWRRYGEHANEMIDAIAKDPSLSNAVIEGAGIRWCEIDYLASSELIVSLEDFLRRRSKVELLIPRETLKQSPGLYKACEQFFGVDAKMRFDEYFENRQ